MRNRPQAEDLHRLGLSRLRAGDAPEAERLIRCSIDLCLDEPRYHANLGSALGAMGRLDEAIAALRTAVRLDPGYAEGHQNLGVALERSGRVDEAICAYRRAIELRPSHGPGYSFLGGALRRLHRIDEAVDAHRQAARLSPRDGTVHERLAAALWGQGDVDGSIASYRFALALRPDSAACHSSLIFAMLHDGQCSPARRLQESVAWAKRHASGLPALADRGPQESAPAKRLRIGYVSPDLVEHPAARILLPVLRAHDRERFEAICYCSAARPDAMTRTLQALADGWRDIHQLSDDRAAELVRRDRIDILIDLSGHMAENRLLLFARKPAPVQVTFTYPGTTGMSSMDYRITDEHSDPRGVGDAQHVEQLIRLPCAWAYDPGELPPVAELPAIQNGFVTFGCLNRPIKVSDAALALWARVLDAVPRSRLMLSSGSSDGRNSFLGERLARHGIRQRCDLVPLVPRPQYLQRFNQVDLALDPFPYNGEATTLDGLWTGVPLVTLAGDSCVSRRGVSHLSTLGLQDMIATDDDDYVRIACALAEDLPRLAELRRTLRDRIRSSMLGDGPSYTRELERALQRMTEAVEGGMVSSAGID